MLDRVPGVSLLELARDNPGRRVEWAEVLARAHAGILALQATGLRDVRAGLGFRIQAAHGLSDRHRQQILNVLGSLEGGDRLLHGDFHPSNLFVGPEEETVIDWAAAARGPAAADIARTLVLLSPESIPPTYSDRDELVRLVDQFREIYRAHVLDLAGVDDEEVVSWMLPVLAARPCEEIEWERESLLRRIESALRFV